MLHDIAPHKYDVTYRKAKAADDDVMLIFRDGKLLCCLEDEKISYPQAADIEAVFPQVKEKAKFLFRIDEKDYFELRKHDIEPFDHWQYEKKDAVRSMRPLWKAFAAVTGFQIHYWYTNTKFCGRCGSKMKAQGQERAMKCPECGKVYYPQICPSVIVGVVDGDKLLMTKYSVNHSAYRKYTLIAGYAEVGESLEDTVRREVMEEVGLHVKNIRYFSSQPWSYTDTLLVGFFCELDGSSEITMDRNELSVAEWLEKDEIPQESADDTVSLTGTMMKAFKEGQYENAERSGK